MNIKISRNLFSNIVSLKYTGYNQIKFLPTIVKSLDDYTLKKILISIKLQI